MQTQIQSLVRTQFHQSADLPYDADVLSNLVTQRLTKLKHGDIYRWNNALSAIKSLVPTQAQYDLNQATIQIGETLTPEKKAALFSALQTYIPWRKGPLNIHGVHINSEWRSDFKWRRIAPHLNLTGAKVLDIGCANAYHALRILGAGAQHVIGIEPSLGTWFQYLSATRSCPKLNFWFVNLPFESLPESVNGFDFIFSLGVIYHRKQPLEHLTQIQTHLAPKGKLILETLTLPDDYPDNVLVPDERYCQMRNVWHVPKNHQLLEWLTQAGFKQHNIISLSHTTPAEQRSTAWMRFHSLPQFLNPSNPQKTIEGHPAPRRSIIIAQR